MKNNILLLLLLTIVYTCSGSTNFTIKFVGNTNNLAIEKNGEIFISNLYSNPLILNTKNFEEPCKMSIVDIKGNKKIFFYLDNQSSEISIRTSDLTVQFTNSKLNTEYNQYLHFIDSFNVLMDSNRIAYLKFKDLEFNAANYVASLKYSARIKSLEQEQQMYLYNWCLKHTKSFVCFDFIEYQLQENYIDKQKLRKLFSVLDTSLHKYPSYKKNKKTLQKTNFEVGDTIKDFKLQLENNTIQFQKIAENNFVYIDFWNPENEPSISSQSTVSGAFTWSIKNNTNWKFISICLDADSVNWMKKSNELGINWYNAIDTNPEKSIFSSFYNTEHLPCGVLINPDGIVVKNNIMSTDDRSEAFKLLYLNPQKNTTLTAKPQNIVSEKKHTYSTATTLKLIGKNINNYQLEMNGEILINHLKSINKIVENINEPTKILLIDTKTSNYIFFYLDIGIHDITIDIDKSIISSKTSKLNADYNDIWQIKKKYDLITKAVSKQDSIEISKIGFRANNNRIDSVYRLYLRALYEKSMQQSKSFASLMFVNFLVGEYSQVGISNQEVFKLFNNLDTNLFKYPIYQETKKMIEENLMNSNNYSPKDVINDPLWNRK